MHHMLIPATSLASCPFTLQPTPPAPSNFIPNQPQLEEVLSPEVRAARYPALDPVLLAAAADKYKELPGQAKKEPGWPTRRAVEAFAKQLRLQLVSGSG